MAFDFFARARADIAVIEVGMGGRLDSTNVIVPEVAVITQIDFDHENFLGHSIEEIAAEKAGIIKPGAWVVSAAENPAAREVIRRRAAEQHARLVEIDEECRVSRPERGRRMLSLQRGPIGPVRSRLEAGDWKSRCRWPGAFRCATRLRPSRPRACWPSADLPLHDEAIVRGIASVRWPGRLERLQERPAVYLDGTHNPAGARELLAFWHEHLAGRRIHLIYGAMRDKAIDEVAGLLFPHAATVILTQSPQPRSLSAEALLRNDVASCEICRSDSRARRGARTRARNRRARRRNLRDRLALSGGRFAPLLGRTIGSGMRRSGAKDARALTPEAGAVCPSLKPDATIRCRCQNQEKSSAPDRCTLADFVEEVQGAGEASKRYLRAVAGSRRRTG